MRLFLAIAALLVSAGQAQNFGWCTTGQARVVDGDSLWLLHPVQVFCIDLATCGASNIIHPDGIEIRLYGIDAFELRQICKGADGKPWRCGSVAKAQLANMTENKRITCYGGGPGLGSDRDGREFAVCYLRHLNLNDDMVRLGLALAYRHQSDAFVQSEDAARSRHAGVWAGSFVAPWDWQSGKR